MTETCTTEQVPNPGYIPPFEGYWATVENPDHVPAVPETTVFDGYMKWNWTGGPLDYTPAAPGGTDDWGWHQVGITNDSKGGTPDVVHQGNGKASFFYYESAYTVTPAIPEQGTPTIDIWVEGSPAVGEEFLIEVTCEEPPLVCPENKVPGWLDENGIPQGCVDNNPNPITPKEPPITIVEPTDTQVVSEQVSQPVTSQQAETGNVEELALTGAGDMWGLGLAASLFLAVGAALVRRALKR